MCVRVELHKRRVLEQCDLDQEMIYEELRRKKVVQDVTMERIKAQLLVSMFYVFSTSLPDNRFDLQSCTVIFCKHCVAVSIRRQKKAS